MEHEVFVPVPAERLAEALADPVRVARAIPGLQQDAGTGPLAGRLKVRVGGHTITYRGTLRVAGRDDGSYAVEGEAAEARGTGTVKLSLSLRLSPAEQGTTVTFTGSATGDGRIAELPAEAVTSAATRLLGRFAEHLGEPVEEGEATGPDTADREAASVFDTEVPPPSLDPSADQGGPEPAPDDEIEPGLATQDASDDFDEEPPAEAAHARRTMIGRSAEEVDHAPPRGRYAPVPAPQTVTANQALRWAAPAAALAVASAIVVGRALRKRR
jgi:carbon monoxide dehydrogenase subunit G